MRIKAITAHDESRHYRVTLPAINSALLAIYGPAQSGKTALADLLGHALFGKRRVASAGTMALDGELIVEDENNHYRVRATHDHQVGHTRLTVAAIDGGPIDHHTVRRLVGGLPPAVLTPLCVVSFHESPDVGRLFAPDFVNGLKALTGESAAAVPVVSRRTSELAARRDQLAQELETRIATDRRASKELEARWSELDRLVREEQQHTTAAEQRLKAVENSLAETDARLRYRRLELNVELRWNTGEPADNDRSTDLEAQVARCRQILAELNERESAARARLAQLQTVHPNMSWALTDQQAWLAVSRQLAADLSGEVARLARAGSSSQCVCREAHPRLRPIAETIERQLAVLEKSVEAQRHAAAAAEAEVEVDHLTRAQNELRRHLEHLLERSQVHVCGTPLARQEACAPVMSFSAADAEQLERRRLELEQERMQLAGQVNAAVRKLKVLRAERDAIERERAALLSARSIEHIQRELAHVQKKLEGASSPSDLVSEVIPDVCLMQASDYLAQLTNGDIRRLMVANEDGQLVVVNHYGETVPVDRLNGGEHDQVYMSMCLALIAEMSGHGVWLPLVLDEPFTRLDSHEIGSLTAVLDAFSRKGHQVIVFTRQTDAAERLAAVGAETHDMFRLRQGTSEGQGMAGTTTSGLAAHPALLPATDGDAHHEERRRRKKKIVRPARNGDSPDTEHSDAA